MLLVAAAAVVAEHGSAPGGLAGGQVDAVVALVDGEGQLAAAETMRAQTGGALVNSARPREHADSRRGQGHHEDDWAVKKATRGYVVDSAKPSETTPPAGSGVSVGPSSAGGKKTERKKPQ